MEKCIYALDAGGSYLKCALIDGKLNVIPGTHDSAPADSAGGTPADIRAAYAALAVRAKARAAEKGYEIVSVGMDTPGPFDYPTGTFRMTHKYTALYGVSVLPWFAEDFPGAPVHIIHDSAAFILGASRALADGEAKYESIAAVMLGTGLGFALMCGGQPLLNPNGGPLVSIYRSPLRGEEAEELISARGIVRCYRECSGTADSSALSAKEVALRAKSGDAAALRAYSDTGILLGELLAPILAEYRVGTLLLGGQISRDCALFMPGLCDTLSASGYCGRVLPAPNADDAHLIGAAMNASGID